MERGNIQEEKDSLEKNKTWIEIDYDEIKNKKILSAKWVFKIKEGRSTFGS